MRLNFVTFSFCLSVSLLLAVPFAYADIKADGGFKAACEKPENLNRAAVTLHPRDKSGLKLARSFENHLRAQGKDPTIIRSLYNASMSTGVDFELLLLKAIMESDLGRANFASKSTARGVFQYIESTWLILMARHGEALGYPHYQEAVKIDRKTGGPYMAAEDAFLRTEILALRHDPEIAAMMKAYQIMDETDVIRGFKGSKVTSTDHYIAHMLGLSLAKEFYELRARNSVFAVARLGKASMREAAKLNRPFFYDSKKNPLRAPDVYKRFEARVKQELKALKVVSKTPYKEPCAEIQNVALR